MRCLIGGARGFLGQEHGTWNGEIATPPLPEFFHGKAVWNAVLCSGSEAGSYLRLVDFVYHSTLGLRVIKKKEREVDGSGEAGNARSRCRANLAHVRQSGLDFQVKALKWRHLPLVAWPSISQCS